MESVLLSGWRTLKEARPCCQCVGNTPQKQTEIWHMTDKRTSLRSRDKLSGRMEGNGLRALSRGGGCNKLPTGNINSQEFDHSWQDLGMGSSAPLKAHQVPGTEEHPYSSGQGGRKSLNITKRFYFQEIDEWAMPAPLLTQTPLGSSAAFDGYGS